ncbi:hypothetical protein CEXT_715991 [Caerostris extrusa]|uniref:Uncharacterized protein n=1 Tax=Caerostris extrusa TaxID=172846 RepID=A0AAV4P883_CAEEX|nr:hypothetical protein CEXT_715991 [Caerostris extrusa]
MNKSCTEMKIWNSDENNVKSYIKVNNCTYNESFDYPDHLTFNEVFIKEIFLCTLMLIFAVCDNLLVFVTLTEINLKISRVYKMMMHLIISDLIMILSRFLSRWLGGSVCNGRPAMQLAKSCST